MFSFKNFFDFFDFAVKNSYNYDVALDPCNLDVILVTIEADCRKKDHPLNANNGHNIGNNGHNISIIGHNIGNNGHNIDNNGHNISDNGHNIGKKVHNISNIGHNISDNGHFIGKKGNAAAYYSQPCTRKRKSISTDA
ncbi:hypothetical protein FACS1894200_10070 [Spirochaetia bacterium]|nr:hypothetical protein FACS1894200_10070 [Spirochaetia bacterium]